MANRKIRYCGPDTAHFHKPKPVLSAVRSEPSGAAPKAAPVVDNRPAWGSVIVILVLMAVVALLPFALIVGGGYLISSGWGLAGAALLALGVLVLVRRASRRS
jgi:hypothetical protein